MGKEAYMLDIVLNKSYSSNIILESLLEFGFKITQTNSKNEVYFEKKYNEGFLEMLTRNSMNEISIIKIRIAKPNSIEIIEKLKEFLLHLNELYTIEYIKDYETKKKLSLNNFDDLKEIFKCSKQDFDKWYPGIKFPIRCNDVFKTYKGMHPEEYE